jgi:hypothetical protein
VTSAGQIDWSPKFSGNDARKGKWMKIFLAVLALCAFAPGALAAGADCRAVESSSARLACYDAASPPKIDKPKGIEKTADKDATRPEYKDPFLAEEARTTAKLKNICRGC